MIKKIIRTFRKNPLWKTSGLAPGKRAKLRKVISLHTDDYNQLEKEDKAKYQERQGLFRKSRDEKMSIQRSGQALACDVTRTLNGVIQTVCSFLLFSSGANLIMQLISLFQRTGQASFLASVRTGPNSHAKPVLLETTGFEGFFLNKFKLTHQMLLDMCRDYTRRQVEEKRLGERLVPTVLGL